MLYAFDLDGTLIRSFMRDEPCDVCRGSRTIRAKGRELSCPECVRRYDLVEALPGRFERLRQLATDDAEASFALVTNQGGVAFGYQTEDEVADKIANIAQTFEFFYGCAFSVHVAYGHPNAKLEEYRAPEHVVRRKPSPAMLHEAMGAHRRGTASTIYVGDLDSDRECAAAAGVTYVDASAFFRDRSTPAPSTPIVIRENAERERAPE